jgi:hypothetical protein
VNLFSTLCNRLKLLSELIGNIIHSICKRIPNLRSISPSQAGLELTRTKKNVKNQNAPFCRTQLKRSVSLATPLVSLQPLHLCPIAPFASVYSPFQEVGRFLEVGRGPHNIGFGPFPLPFGRPRLRATGGAGVVGSSSGVIEGESAQGPQQTVS